MNRMSRKLLLVLCVTSMNAVMPFPVKADGGAGRTEVGVKVASVAGSSVSRVRAVNQEVPARAALRLEDLERMALQHNPTLAQAVARIRAAL